MATNTNVFTMADGYRMAQQANDILMVYFLVFVGLCCLAWWVIHKIVKTKQAEPNKRISKLAIVGLVVLFVCLLFVFVSLAWGFYLMHLASN